MKLRNKKTGLVGELHYEPDKEYHFTLATEDPADMEIYRTLSELNEEWEDCKEPLIKDEKIRKAVRVWAKANSFERVYNQNSSYFVAKGQHIDFVRPPMIDVPSGNYTITELCGEEEE